MNLTLSVVQFVGIMISILGSFTMVFWALQRYVGVRVEQGLERFDEHAERLEDKLDNVVAAVSDLKNALTGVSREHASEIRNLGARVDRLDDRLRDVEKQ